MGFRALAIILLGTCATAHSAIAQETFEYKMGGVTVAFEFQDQGTAMVVINQGPSKVSIAPLKVEVKTPSGSKSPCTIHDLGMFGLGAPLMSITVEAGKTTGYMLGACSPIGTLFIVDHPSGVKVVFD